MFYVLFIWRWSLRYLSQLEINEITERVKQGYIYMDLIKDPFAVYP